MIFPVEIWGTVGQWASAILTGGGLLVASLVYWRDSNLSRSAQAKRIHARLVDPYSVEEKLKVHIQNYSEARIFDIGVEVNRADFALLVLDRAEEAPGLSLEQAYAETLEKWNATPADIRHRSEDTWTLEPGRSFEIEVPVESRSYQQIAVSFNDLKGRRWRIAGIDSQATTLTLVKDDPIYPPQPRRWGRSNLLRRIRVARTVLKMSDMEFRRAMAAEIEAQRSDSLVNEIRLSARGSPTPPHIWKSTRGDSRDD